MDLENPYKFLHQLNLLWCPIEPLAGRARRVEGAIKFTFPAAIIAEK